MTGQPTFTNLVDFVEGRLDQGASAGIERSLAAGDPEAGATVAWLRTFLFLGKQLPLEAPPVRVRYYLQRQFEQRSGRAPARARPVRQLLAALMFDSRRDLVAEGVRSGGVDAKSVHLAFSSPEAEVLVDLSSRRGGHLRIDGQVLWTRQGPQASEATVTAPGSVETSRTGDELGRFSFDRVPADVDRLLVQGADVEIELMWEPWEAP